VYSKRHVSDLFSSFQEATRHFLLSAIIPYVYILLIGLSILLVSFIAGALETHSGRQLVIFGWGLSPEGLPSLRCIYSGYWRGVVADFFLPGHALGADHVPARSDGRNDRDSFMGDHPPGVSLVLLGRLFGEFDLRFFCHVSGGPDQHGGDRGDNLLGARSLQNLSAGTLQLTIQPVAENG